MNLISIGNNGFLPTDKIIAVVEYNVHLTKTRDFIREKKQNGRFVNFTGSSAYKTLIILSTGDLVVTSVATKTIIQRINEICSDEFLTVYKFFCVKKSEIVLITERNYVANKNLKTRQPVAIKVNSQNIKSVIWTQSGYVFYTAMTSHTLKEKVRKNHEK